MDPKVASLIVRMEVAIGRAGVITRDVCHHTEGTVLVLDEEPADDIEIIAEAYRTLGVDPADVDMWGGQDE